MSKPEIETLGSTVVYKNRWMSVREDSIVRADGSAEPPILTAGNEVSNLARFLKPDTDSYSAADVVSALLT